MLGYWFMKKIRIISVICLLGFLSACAPGEVDNSGGIFDGQWTKPKPMGNGKFFTEGYNTRDAIQGATEFCNRTNKSFDSIDLTPSNAGDNTRATLIFKCV